MTIYQPNGEENLGDVTTGSYSSTMSLPLTYANSVYPRSETDEVDSLQQFRGSSGNLSSTASSSYLPNEFQVIQDNVVPILQNLEEADHDFIIVAEFSELEGPIPISTIPSNAPEKTDINLNSFAVHLMSTDYQVNTVGQFGICEDTQVLRTNVFMGVHVFMQYFTLFDIKARGFVRPFCFGYVSKDSVKLDRIVKTLIEDFNQITKVLKQANRSWFSSELTQYLDKLVKAKDEFIFRSSSAGMNNDDEEDVAIIFDVEEDTESVSLNHIAQQYSEIENILKTVKDAMNGTTSGRVSQQLSQLSLSSLPEESPLSTLLRKLDFLGDTFPLLEIPLVHPLKQKGESLRPLTTLGQLGTVWFLQQLMMIYEENRRDVIFTEMECLTHDFQNHFRFSTGSNTVGYSPAREKRKFDMTSVNEYEAELCCVLEKTHTTVPIAVSDDRSGSYHSLSTEDESEGGGSTPKQNSEYGATASSFKSAMDSVESKGSKSLGRSRHMSDSIVSASSSSFSTTSGASSTSKTTPFKEPELGDFLCRLDMNSSWTIIEPRKSSSSLTSEDGTSTSARSKVSRVQDNGTPIEIQKLPWWNYAAKTKLQKGDPGYALRKFWIHFPKLVHHILFSILIGRPIILFGSLKYRGRVAQVINAILPFVPCFPSESFKILKWHQGILVSSHLDGTFKLIGLAIPERLTIHDLLNPRDQNSVTSLDVEKKRIFGPAYSGNYFKQFENMAVSKTFFDDLSLLTYIGSILAEIETQVYMCKSLACEEGKGSSPASKIVKELQLKNSDAEIVKYLSSCIREPEQCVNLF